MNYGKVHTLGHKDVRNIFDYPVVVQEKVDGSRFTFGVLDGELKCWSGSRHNELSLDEYSMFSPAIIHVKALHARNILAIDTVYYCEFLAKPKHNKNAYARVPRNNLVLFDVYNVAAMRWVASRVCLADVAMGLDIDVAPELFVGKIHSPAQIDAMLNIESYLGKAKIEGVVCKRYEGPQIIRAKYVSNDFKEIAGRRDRPRVDLDIITDIAQELATDNRFMKAYQAVRDQGRIGQVADDIPRIIKALGIDLGAECQEYVAGRLMAWGWKKVQREVSRKLPDWYKAKLAEDNFEPMEVHAHDKS